MLAQVVHNVSARLCDYSELLARRGDEVDFGEKRAATVDEIGVDWRHNFQCTWVKELRGTYQLGKAPICPTIRAIELLLDVRDEVLLYALWNQRNFTIGRSFPHQ